MNTTSRCSELPNKEGQAAEGDERRRDAVEGAVFGGFVKQGVARVRPREHQLHGEQALAGRRVAEAAAVDEDALPGHEGILA